MVDMLNKRKALFGSLLVLILVISVSASGCTSEEEEGKGELVVGTSADFPPFEYMDEDDNIVGFDIELIKEIAESQGYEVTVQDMSFDSLIPSVKNEQIDVVAAAMTINEKRKEEIDFTDPYYEADQSVLLREGSDIQIDEVEDLADHRVGAQTGTTGANYVNTNLVEQGNLNSDDFNRYETYLLAIRDLTNENIDAVVLDKPVAEAFAAERSVEVVHTIETGEAYGFGVTKGNEELLEDLNTVLEEFMGTEEWTQLVNKYFGE